jgi:hypothetical protein
MIKRPVIFLKRTLDKYSIKRAFELVQDTVQLHAFVDTATNLWVQQKIS